jgi:hypothetical protein
LTTVSRPFFGGLPLPAVFLTPAFGLAAPPSLAFFGGYTNNPIFLKTNKQNEKRWLENIQKIDNTYITDNNSSLHINVDSIHTMIKIYI